MTRTAHAQCGPGRPRGYDRDAALDAALEVFWRRGYEAASLDELTAAMGLSRSSFYACFGSKQAALAEAFDAYNRRGLELMREVADAAPDGRAAALAALRALARPDGDPRGCFLLNAVAERAADDPALAAAGRAHLDRIEALIADRLAATHGAAAPATARALMALGLGGSALRKAGLGRERLEAMLTAAERLLDPPA